VGAIGVAVLAGAGGVGPAAAQTGSVEGRVRAGAGRPIASAAVSLLQPPDTTSLRTVESDALGRFRIGNVVAGEYLVRARSLGYADTTVALAVRAGASSTLELVLSERAVDLPGVTVEVDRARARYEREAATTRRELTGEELAAIPGIIEKDVLRAVEVLPGVVSTSDYTSSFNVRGGSADQNLILLDGVPIYNPFHLGGLFSVFNADIVARAELLAGGFPAEYGGRVASVLSVESDATGAGTDIDAGISLLATRVALGAELPAFVARPIGVRSGRMRLSVRRSYFDALLAPVLDFPYHLVDAQVYAEGWTEGGRRVSLTAYSGRDVLDFARSEDFPLRVRWGWGNDLIGARYTLPLARGRALDARVGYTRFATDLGFPDFDDTELRGAIGQFFARLDADIHAGDAVHVRAGLHADRFAYDNRAATGGTEFAGGGERGWLAAAYLQASLRRGDWLVDAGVRAEAALPAASRALGVVSPRLGVKRFLADGDVALKLAGGRYAQFVHSIRDEELPLGIDVWVLSGRRAPHTVSDQAQLGIEAYPGAGWFAALEGYYRWFDGVVTNNFAENPNSDTDEFIGGTGESYGVDLLLRRDGGRLRPTLSVSWLRAWREFEDPSLGLDPPPAVRYPPVFDRRVDVELVVQAQLARGFEAGLRWAYGGGLPYTRPRGGHTFFDYMLIDARVVADPPTGEDEIAIILGPRNAERYPAYHRLDVSLRKTFRRSWGTITPHLDVLNVYDRRNVLFYFYEFDRSPPVRSGISMFPFLPTFGAEVSF
jgi:hypothetical protein